MKESLTNPNTGMFKFWANAAENQLNANHMELLRKSDVYERLATIQHGLKGQAGDLLGRLLQEQKVGKDSQGNPITGLGQLWDDLRAASIARKTSGTAEGGSTGSIADDVKTPPGTQLPPQIPKKSMMDTIELITSPDSTPELRKNALSDLTRDIQGNFFKPLR
jgi:hypothetical protein